MLMAVNDDDHDNDGNTYRFRGLRLNYYAVVALKARVYLWAGNKTEALKYAKMIIENPEAETLYPAVTRAAGYRLLQSGPFVFIGSVVLSVE